MWGSGEYRIEYFWVGVTALFGCIVLFDTGVLRLPLVRSIVGFVFLTFVVGGSFLTAIGSPPEPRADWILYALGSSLIVIMMIGLIMNLVLPEIGVANPIAAGPFVAALSGFVIVAAAVSRYRHAGPDVVLQLTPSTWLDRLRHDGLQIGVILLLPIVSVLSITYLNVSGNAVPLLVLLATVASFPFLVVLGVVDERYFALATAANALAILHHKGLWAGASYGGHASVVGIYERGIWRLVGEELLPNTILMPGYGHVLGVEILTQLKVVMPVLVAFIPVAMFVTFRRYTSATAAYLGAALFMFAHPFYFQYPLSPRASMPVLFLVLIGTVTSQEKVRPLVQRTLALMFAAGVAVSHYGTSYYVMFAIIAALIAMFHFGVVDRIVARMVEGHSVTDGGVRRELRSRLHAGNLLRVDFVAFYTTVVLAWYYYIDRSSRVLALAERIVDSYTSLLTSGDQGVTATRLATDYGGLSIQYSKYLYLIVAFLAGTGLLIAFVRRYVPQWETRFTDEYLSFSALLFALFGGTFILSGQWGGGRPMMIVLSFNAIFVIVAAVTLNRGINVWYERLARRLSDELAESVKRSPDRLGGLTVAATILAVLFLVNSGFMAAVAYGGDAPSNVPQTDVDSIHKPYDMNTHIWIADHRNDDYQIYGDRLTRQQTTDWMNGEIAARSERQPVRFKPNRDFSALDKPGLERGYVLYTAHNVLEDQVNVNYVRWEPIERYDVQAGSRSLVYSNGAGRVYFVGNGTQEFMNRDTSQPTEGSAK